MENYQLSDYNLKISYNFEVIGLYSKNWLKIKYFGNILDIWVIQKKEKELFAENI